MEFWVVGVVAEVEGRWYQRRVSSDVPGIPGISGGMGQLDGSGLGGAGAADGAPTRRLPRLADDPRQRFGTEPFYAAIGRAFLTMCAVVPALYLVELVDLAFGGGLDVLGGIQPRRLDGIDGVLFAPLLHVGFGHLTANSVPLILLGTFVLAGQTRRFLAVTATIVIVGGLVVWLFGAPGTVVVGASGVVFGYLGYLFMRGIVERSLWHLGVAVLVGLLYGWTVAGVLPGDPRVSWLGHLGGLVAGVAAALVFRSWRGRSRAAS